jgi:hypothetical protein
MKKTLLLSATLLFAASTYAQDYPAQDYPAQDSVMTSRKMNIVKLNVPAMIFGNFSFQYERILSKRFSAALGFSTRPMTTLPFNDQISSSIGDNDNVKDIIEKTKLGSTTFTPEIRWYLGKGYGKGFYIAPYYRYSKFDAQDITVHFTDDLGRDQEFRFSGNVSAHSGGVMLGAQWHLSKRLSLDWWIVGAHFGNGSGTIKGTSANPLTADERNEIEDQLNDVELPSGKLEVEWSADGRTAKSKIDGPWVGARAGLSLGFRF